ncbi:NADH-quinone oxidoreductase subunit N [Paenibacillus sp. MAHUQ-46]|uniref:NADH-quinone oxidoreductase subunit N n=1 Tax=Paenibacillus roseus TaxID=2798579 RepID=A0A934MQW0_9BACL|nr:NADH-quinone oxidoreductase subunit N [Paenibacillus roseus]MBJ6361734.1 NADH-quinone oxidoreductase subunit N [Paenibacillus roseus]
MYLNQPIYNQVSFSSFLFENDYLALIPEIFLISAGIFLLVYGCIFSTSSTYNFPILSTNIGWFVILTFIYTILLIYNAEINNAILLYNTLVIDDFTQFIKICCLLASAVTILISLDYLKAKSLNAFESMILILLATVGMLFLISSADFISLYLTIELQSLAFYVLAALKRNSEFSTEAGIKYFLLGAFSSGLLLFGCSLIYGFTGTISFSECAKLFAGTAGLSESISTSTFSIPACQLGIIFLLTGFLFKIAAAPFHMWSPDVYEGAPTPVTTFFTVTPKLAFFAAFLRLFLEGFYDLIDTWQTVIIISSSISMILGAFAALTQNKIKRFLAFSSISHAGYLLVGFACASIEGVQSLLLYLIVYIVMNIAVFAIILSGTRHTKNHTLSQIKYITDLAYLAKTNPLIAITFTITMFSMAGIPPFAGFYSKAFLFFSALSSNLGLLAILGILTSVLTCFYYIRLIRIMYFSIPKTWCNSVRIPRGNAYILALSFYFLTFFIFYPAPLYLVVHKAALALCI